MNRISIIIPNYNHASFLKERIDSVLSQTFQDFEVILLDDCSTDDSKSIIESYRDHPKISHIIYNEVNSGSTFVQWEKGISLAKGKWIWIAESDDVALPSFLEAVIQKASEDDSIVCSYCASMEINEESEQIKAVDWAFNISDRNWDDDYITDGIDEIKHQFYYKCIIPNASAAIFKKSAVDFKIFKQITKMRFAGDWLFWVKMIENGKIAYTSTPLNNFRLHGLTTRSVKSSVLEKQRFSESLSVIFYMQKKYNLSWNWDKHYWIINDWFYKFNFNSKRDNFDILQLFPFAYKGKMLLKYAVDKLKNFIKAK